LIVDGQHRLFAQKFAAAEALYACVIHMGRTEQQMASLFLEINDNQRRVPSSLRWDLVRLVRSEDQATQMTSDLVFELATNKESPFYSVGIDLTGEQKDGSIKQGSLAPEIRTLVSRLLKKDKELAFQGVLDVLMRYFAAVRSLDPDGWGTQQSPFYRARVLRALIRVLSDLLGSETSRGLTTEAFRKKLKKIDPATISDAALRKAQGSAGVQDLYKAMSSQIVGK
jgi:DGQHR domain-containing protein